MTASTRAFPAAPPAASAEPFARLRDGVRSLRTGGRARTDQRLLLVLGGTVAPLGVVLVLLGWQGAAHTANVFEQIPYLISGGLLGVALVFLGGFLYFTHWLTVLVQEHRSQAAAVVDAIRALESALVAVPARPGGTGTVPTTDLVATALGTMAHRRTCPVVAGAAGLRPVPAGSDLEPCRLCHSTDDP